METLIEPYIELYSGKNFYFLDPKFEDFDIVDIAHALSLTCRFSGQCKKFLSVAEHSVMVSNMLEGTGFELEGLLHDAGEAYLPDVASPVKQFLPDYNKIEDTITSKLFEKYGLQYPLRPKVKFADIWSLSTEAFYLLPSRGDTWGMWANGRPPIMEEPACWGFEQAKEEFLKRFYQLTNEAR